jgi:uncharacterized membrane protein
MQPNDHKKNFQLERIALFSDAVFAIAITLLVIEIKVPELDETTNGNLSFALGHLVPHLFSFLLSFMVIGIYWLSHHRMFNYIINYDRKLLWLNLLFLFFIALMPFSSNVYGVYGQLNTAFYIYVLNISFVALFNFSMWNYVGNPKNHLSHGLENPRTRLFYKLRSWSVPVCFFVGILVTLVSDSAWSILVSRFSPLLIFPAMAIIKRNYGQQLQ